MLASIFQDLRPGFPDSMLIVVPRHFERSPAIASQIAQMGLRVALRNATPSPGAERPDVLVVDTTGELRDWYDCATLVFIGKSLMAKGGQNPAEAIAAGKPVIFGPNMQNFASLSQQLCEAGAAIQVDSEAALKREIAALLADPKKREKMAASGAKCLGAHRGATERTRLALEALAARHPVGGQRPN